MAERSLGFSRPSSSTSGNKIRTATVLSIYYRKDIDGGDLCGKFLVEVHPSGKKLDASYKYFSKLSDGSEARMSRQEAFEALMDVRIGENYIVCIHADKEDKLGRPYVDFWLSKASGADFDVDFDEL